MSKYSGKIGYIRTGETQPGVWGDLAPEEKSYTGDLIKDNRRFSANQTTPNDNLTINNTISIVSNKFMLDNLSFMRYLTLSSTSTSKWKITSVDIKHPRIIITLGGLYNE